MKKLSILCFIFLMAQSVAAQNDTTIITNGESVIFSRVEVDASFPGGEQAWRNFLMRNLNPQIPINNDAPAGLYVVIVKFIVNKDGEVTEVKAETNNGYGTEEEAIRIIKKSGNWFAARQNGRLVNAYRRQPITFAVEDEDIHFSSKQPFIFYTNTDNILDINVRKISDDNIDVTVDNGTITKKGDGRYIVKVEKPGKVIVEVFNTKKKRKSIGKAKFDVIATKMKLP